jgi:endosialidase-like protein
MQFSFRCSLRPILHRNRTAFIPDLFQPLISIQKYRFLLRSRQSPCDIRLRPANADSVPVVMDATAQLGTVRSWRRFHNEIKPMDKTSETNLGLKPVTFHYKSDMQNPPQLGSIAEETNQSKPGVSSAQ